MTTENQVMGKPYIGEETAGEYSYDYSFKAHGETVHVGAHLDAHEAGIINTPIHWRVGETEGANGWFEYMAASEFADAIPGAAFVFATEHGEEPRFDGQRRRDVGMSTEIADQLSEDKEELREQHHKSLIPERRKRVIEELMDTYSVDSQDELPEGWEERVESLMEERGHLEYSPAGSNRD